MYIILVIEVCTLQIIMTGCLKGAWLIFTSFNSRAQPWSPFLLAKELNNKYYVIVMESRKESEYQVKLDYETKRRYKQKLKFQDEELPDPYLCSLLVSRSQTAFSVFLCGSELDLLNNPILWPDIEFGNI